MAADAINVAILRRLLFYDNSMTVCSWVSFARKRLGSTDPAVRLHSNIAHNHHRRRVSMLLQIAAL